MCIYVYEEEWKLSIKVCVYTSLNLSLRTLMFFRWVWFFKQSISLFNVVCLRTCIHHMWISKQQQNNTEKKCWRWERFVVLCDSVQGAIVETISQLFSLACDRLVGLMWEPHTPPPPLSTLLFPTTNTPSPQRLRLATESAGGKGVCTAVASEQERERESKKAGEG